MLHSGTGPLIGSRADEPPLGAGCPTDEQEVDLASAWQRLKLRWWLPVGGLVVGAVVGLALALSGGSVWRAETIVYLGQPFAPLGGGQIQSLATNPRTVGEIIRSESVLQDVSDATEIPVSQLRSSISTRELVAAGQVRGINPLIEIGVKGDAGPRKIEAAADALAARVVESVSVYVAEKVELLEQQVAVSEAQLAAVEARIQAAQRQQDTLITGPVDPARPAAPPERESELGDHDRGRAQDLSPGRPLRGAAAPQPGRERRVEPRRRAGCRGEDDRALEPDLAPRGCAARSPRRRDRGTRRRAVRRAPARRNAASA